MNRLRFILFLVSFISLKIWAQPPVQSKVSGFFLTDSIEVGRPFRYSLTYRHSPKVDVFFPDTATFFRPYRVQKIDIFPTQTTGTASRAVSRDSAIYTLVSFEINPIQSLKVPIRIINEADCTMFWSNVDTVFLRSKISLLTADSTALLKPAIETKLAPLQQQFNYSLLIKWILLISIVAILLYGLFGRPIRQQWRLYLLNRRHIRFLNEFNRLIQRLTPLTVSEITNQAVVMWKMYLEQLERQPYIALTTSELSERINNEEVTRSLREADRMIYGGTFSEQSQAVLWVLRDVATKVYHRSRTQLKGSDNFPAETQQQLDSSQQTF